MEYKVFIVDDMEPDYYSLVKMLKAYDQNFKVISHYLGRQPFDDALEIIPGIKPDLLFVDYDLQEGYKNGLELCRRVVTKNMLVIFFSRDDDARNSSFKVLAAKEITKNKDFNSNMVNYKKANNAILTEEDLRIIMRYANTFLQQRDSLKIVLEKLTDKSKFIYPVSKVLAFKAYGQYSACYLEGLQEVVPLTVGLDKIAEKFQYEEYGLVRCHRSWIINSTKVFRRIGNKGKYSIILEGFKEEINIGETYEKKAEVAQILDRFN